MNWTELLESEVNATYHATLGLLDLVEDDTLDWKPATGDNWMTTGQLIEHLTIACGLCSVGFVTGEWPMPPDASPEDMMPPAEKMTSSPSVAAAREKLQKDRELALSMIAKAGESDLADKKVPAPWNPTPQPLGQQILSMVGHLAQHKAQLFYYLKLQGKPVHTGTMWGM